MFLVGPFELSRNWQTVLKHGTRQFLRKKTVIYQEGDAGDGFYYLHSGLVKIEALSSAGKDRLLNIVVPGQLVGIQSMDRETHFSTATTLRDSVLYYFSCKRFQELMMAEPELINLLAHTVIQKMKILLDAIKMKAFTAEEHIASVLLNLFGDFKCYDIPLTQQELANCTGLTRITVYKTLKHWKTEGLIDMKSRAFIIKRPDLLKHIVHQGPYQTDC